MVTRVVSWCTLVSPAAGMTLILANACGASTGSGGKATPAADAGIANERATTSPGSSGGISGNGSSGSGDLGNAAGGAGSGSSATPTGPVSCTGPCCTPPTVGSSCPSAQEGTICSGGGICPGGLNFDSQVSCHGGRWQTFGEQCPSTDGGTTAEGCPARQPSSGALCPMPDAGGVLMGVPACPPGGLPSPQPQPGSGPEDASVLCALPIVLSCQYTLVCAPTTCEAGPPPPQPEGGDTCPDAEGVGCSSAGIVSVSCATLSAITAFAACNNGHWETSPLPASCP
jgi:hypothetical protein